VFVWAGAALLGWIAGEIIITDAAMAGWLGYEVVHRYELWAASAGALFVVGLGYLLVRRQRPVPSGESDV
jgi:hypothetical protein